MGPMSNDPLTGLSFLHQQSRMFRLTDIVTSITVLKLKIDCGIDFSGKGFLVVPCNVTGL